MDQGLKITYKLVDTGAGLFQYRFTVWPIGSHPFVTMLYCFQEERDKSNYLNTRKHVASKLRERHAALWKRYHTWRNNNP